MEVQKLTTAAQQQDKSTSPCSACHATLCHHKVRYALLCLTADERVIPKPAASSRNSLE